MTRQAWRKIAKRARQFAQQGQFIEAIKYLRAETGCGLADAYKAANALRDLK